ncbi:uncharacterized protein J4E92_005952 [Alternaria infectoria]|uniref:uncharacterized protein n=1 Tax=Alternaria infectoria TaxID=45303 RepID=UPI00221F861B|nr:uncharacterized protein J4E92_005952 [Alternaria infectoria]KAI4926793.1 hypothetical protein J4E92_005952 [Alternaria infectoria]
MPSPTSGRKRGHDQIEGQEPEEKSPSPEAPDTPTPTRQSLFALSRDQIPAFAPAKLAVKRPKTVVDKYDALEGIYRAWFLVYPDRKGDEECIKVLFPTGLPSQETVRECYKRFKYHSDNWYRETKKNMSAQVRTALADTSLLRNQKDQLTLVEHFANIYSVANFELGFRWCSKFNIQQSPVLVQEYAKYLYTNFAAVIKLNIDWQENPDSDKYDDYGDEWLKAFWKTFAYSKDFDSIQPDHIVVRAKSANRSPAKEKRVFNIALPDANPNIRLKDGRAGQPVEERAD